MRYVVILLCILVNPVIAFSATIIVPDDYSTIQEAIDASVNDDTVLVRPGTYVENIDFKGKAITVTSEQGAVVTFIDGNQAGSVVTCLSNEGPDSILDGFIITNGTGTVVGSDAYGGGIYNNGSSPKVTNCIFNGNSADLGGGMYNDVGNPTVTNCTFFGNSATSGGGIYNEVGNPIITNCILWENQSDQINGAATVTFCCVQGGWPGTGNFDADPLFVDPDNNDFHLTYSPCIDAGDNNAPGIPNYDFEGDPRIFDGDADGMAVVDIGCDEAITLRVPIDFLTIQEAINVALDGDSVVVEPGTYLENIDFLGKAITVVGTQGSDLTVIDGSQLGNVVTIQNDGGKESHLSGFTVKNGSAMDGGGIYCYNSSPRLKEIKILENFSTSGNGGGIYCSTSSPWIENCILANNVSSSSGGGMYCYDSSPNVINCTFFGNSATSGGGIYNEVGNPIITNCILWENQSDQINGAATVTFCCVQGGWPGTGNLDSDPLFVDPDNNDFHLTYSPCIDAGDNDAPGLPHHDFEGDPRIFDGDGDGMAVVDIGCDEAITLRVPIDFLTIQEAINAALDNNIVVVEPGTYFENIDFFGKAITVVGTQGSDLTVIDGSQLGNVVTIQNDGGKESHLLGFTLKNGSAPDGGGIYCNNSSPRLKEIQILGNFSTSGNGGGIYCFNSSPWIENCILANNVSSLSGGGIYCFDSSPTLKEIEINGNSSTSGNGGGIYCFNSFPWIENCILTKNVSFLSGGGIYCFHCSPTLKEVEINGNSSTSGEGGGIYCHNSSPWIENCILTNNVSDSSGGGIYSDESSPTLKFVEINGNSSTNGDGGGIYCSTSSPWIENCTLTNNVSDASGGGIYCYDSSPTLTEIEFIGNSCTNGEGGGIYCSASSPRIENSILSQNASSLSSGGGVFCLDSFPVLVNTLISNNSALMGGGIYSDVGSLAVITNTIIYENSASIEGGGIHCENGSPVITNSIIWLNIAPVGYQIHGTNPVVTYCDVEGSWPGKGNINADPLFLNPVANDFHLTVESPCINWGDNYAPEIPVLDFDGGPRIEYGTVDIGADEYSDGGGVTIRVPKDFSTLQEAINFAMTGDIVLADSGTYYEIIDFKGKAISVKSELGPEVTVIDGNKAGSVVTFNSGESNNSILDGFTITNGIGTWDEIYGTYDTNGGGIYCNNSSPLIQNNIITGNEASIYTQVYGGGGGIYCTIGSPIIQSNIINDNFGGNGGGICSWKSSPYITDNEISFNSSDYGGSGIYIGFNEDLSQLSDNIVSGNIISNPVKLGGSIYYFENHNSICHGNIITDGNKHGIYLRNVAKNTITDNRILNSGETGICIYGSTFNTLIRNHVERNETGIELFPFGLLESDNNKIYLNNFVNNKLNAYDSGINEWDNDYPIGGNFWSDYLGESVDLDGIGDIPYVFQDGIDEYPLMSPYKRLGASKVQPTW